MLMSFKIPFDLLNSSWKKFLNTLTAAITELSKKKIENKATKHVYACRAALKIGWENKMQLKQA